MDRPALGKMDFTGRIKKEMTEGIVRAILEDAHYRVIDTGIEKLIRELCCLDRNGYAALHYPHAMTKLPDFVVMDRDQTQKILVEVKYRASLDKSVIEQVREQVCLFNELLLVCVYANAPDPRNLNAPSRHLRCCRLRMDKGRFQFQSRSKNRAASWKDVDALADDDNLWWSAMSPLQVHFDHLRADTSAAYATLNSAIQALAGILDPGAPACSSDQ